MADLEQLNSLLVRLSEQTSPGGSFQGEPVSAEELEAARACLQLLDRSDDAVVAEFWQGCSAAGASFTSVAKSIGHLLRAGGDAAVLAATLYATLLRTKGSPVSSLFEPFSFTGFMQVLKKASGPAPVGGVAEEKEKEKAPKGKAKGGRKGGKGKASQAHDDDDDSDAMDEDDEEGPTQKARRGGAAAASGSVDAPALSVESLHNLEHFVRSFPLKSYPELLSNMVDGCVDITRNGLSTASGKAARGRAASSPAAAAYLVLCALMDEQHGDLPDTSAMVLHRLLPTLLGQAPGVGSNKRGATQDSATKRTAAMQFVQALFREHPNILPVVGALARQLCLRAGEKADQRAAAVASALELVAAMPALEQLRFCTFVHRLSRSARPAQRLVAVDMAHSLLLELPEPFALTAGWKPFVDGSHGPGEDIAAPWSALCCAVLVQRGDDKAAAVRARALTHLAEVVETFTKLMEAGAEEEEEEEEAGAAAAATGAGAIARCFLMALCGAHLLKLSVAQVAVPAPKAKGAAGAGGKAAAGKAKAGKQGRGGKGAAQHRRVRGAVGSDSEDEVEEVEEEEQVEAAGGNAQEQQGAAEGEAGAEEVVYVEEAVAFLPSRVRPDLGHLMRLAHTRLRDDKAAVRRAALGVLEGCLLLRGALEAPLGRPPGEEDIAAVEAATADSLLSVRKAAMAAASRLVEAFPHEPASCELWVRSALPLIRDPETSIQEALLDALTGLVLDKAAAAAGAGANAAAAAKEVRPVLGALAAAGRGAAACLSRAVAALAAKKALKARQVAKGLESLITAGAAAPEPAAEAAAGEPGAAQGAARRARQEEQGAWILLREVAACEPSAPNWQFLRAAWTQLQKRGGAGAGEEGASLLWVISHAASTFPPDDAHSLAEELLKALLAFNLPLAAAAAHVAALHRLTSSAQGEDGAAAGSSAPAAAAPAAGGKRGKGSKGVGTGAQWAAKLLDAAHDVLSKFMERRGQAMDAAAVWRATGALFVVGEVALLKLSKPPGALVVLVQALTTGAAAAATGAGMSASQALASQPGPSTQAALATAAAASGEGLGPEAAGISGHAWVCLGKLCLVDEGLAKKAAPLFVQELSRSPSPVVRNNCLVALADMCIHFTALVDGYLPRLAALIRDPHALVRRQALALLANLLMKDYVKWRGALFHRFALALVDEAADVRRLAEYLLGDTLATKAPLLAYNHFVEMLFVLNGCQAGLHAGRIGGGGGPGGGATQASADALAAAADTSGAFSLAGASAAMRAKRDVVYFTLLRRMSPEHKFATQAKLVAEVLGGVADGLLPLQEAGAEEVLGDALRLLGSKEIKVSASRLVGADEDGALLAGGDAGPATQAVAEVAKAKGKLVSAMMKKHLVESVVPLLVELRQMLTEARHPLLGALMGCTAALLRDYKAELEDILVADKQLAKEILFDLKQAELAAKQQQQQAAAQAAAVAAAEGAAQATATKAARPGSATPLADELIATGGKAGAQRRAGGVPSATTTPGAGIVAAPGAGARTPGAALLARRTPGSAPGSAGTAGGRTPFTAGGVRSGQAAGGAGIAPAPVSAAKALVRSRQQEGKENQDTGEEDTEAGAGAQQPVNLPAPDGPEQPQRPWGVKLPGASDAQGQRQQGAGRRGNGKGQGQAEKEADRGAVVEATARAVTKAALQGEGEVMGEEQEAKGKGGAGGRGRAKSSSQPLGEVQPSAGNAGGAAGKRTVKDSGRGGGGGKSAAAAAQQSEAPAAAAGAGSRKRKGGS